MHSFPDAVVIGSSDGTERRTVRPGTPVRLRLVNSDSSAQSFPLTGTPFSVAAIDGTDLSGPTPVRDQSIQLGAGARYDLAFTMPAGPVKLGVVGTKTAILFDPPGRPWRAARRSPARRSTPRATVSTAPRPFTASSHFDRSFKVEIGRKLGFLDGKPGNHWSVNGKLYPHTPMYMVSVGDLVKHDGQERLRRHASDAPARPPLPRADPERRAGHGQPVVGRHAERAAARDATKSGFAPPTRASGCSIATTCRMRATA